MLKPFFNWLYGLYVSFRTMIGWYKTRRIWLAYPDPSREQLIDKAKLEDPKSQKYILSTALELNIPLIVVRAHNSTHYQKLTFIGKYGDWSKRPVIMNMKYGASIMISSDLMRWLEVYKEQGVFKLIQECPNRIPEECIIHLFKTEEEAQKDYEWYISSMFDMTQYNNHSTSSGIMI